MFFRAKKIIGKENLINLAKRFLANLVTLWRLRKKHPTCIFYPGATLDSRSNLGCYVVLFENAVIAGSDIGDHTFVQKNSVINDAQIGRFCSIANNVTVGLGQHPTDFVSTHPAFYSNIQPIAKTFSRENSFNPFLQSVLGHDVWIGQNALIMDGVNIGTGAIVAAGAVVVRDIPDYAIVAGVPAKIIKYRFDEDLRQKLIQTKWWDKQEDWLQKNYSLFSDPLKLIEEMESQNDFE